MIEMSRGIMVGVSYGLFYVKLFKAEPGVTE